MIKLLDLNRINNFFYKDFLKIFKDNLLNSSFILSKYLKEFEINFSKFLNIKFCACVGNGTDALEIAIEALDLKKGSEVIIPNFSIISTAISVIKNNLTPIYVDCELDTWNTSPEKIISKYSRKTKAIIITHIYGLPVNLEKVLKFAKKKKYFYH